MLTDIGGDASDVVFLHDVCRMRLLPDAQDKTTFITRLLQTKVAQQL